AQRRADREAAPVQGLHGFKNLLPDQRCAKINAYVLWSQCPHGRVDVVVHESIVGLAVAPLYPGVEQGGPGCSVGGRKAVDVKLVEKFGGNGGGADQDVVAV